MKVKPFLIPNNVFQATEQEQDHTPLHNVLLHTHFSGLRADATDGLIYASVPISFTNKDCAFISNEVEEYSTGPIPREAFEYALMTHQKIEVLETTVKVGKATFDRPETTFSFKKDDSFLNEERFKPSYALSFDVRLLKRALEAANFAEGGRVSLFLDMRIFDDTDNRRGNYPVLLESHEEAKFVLFMPTRNKPIKPVLRMFDHIAS
jgi:hypothetical protein